MIYGTPQYHRDNDVDDRIGLRTLVVSKMWQPTGENPTEAEIDEQIPPPPVVSGGVLIIGSQTRRDGGVYRTTWTFEGVRGDGKGVTFKDRSNSLDYRFQHALSQVSLKLHTDFQKFVDSGWVFIENDGSLYFPLKTNAATGGSGLSTGGDTSGGNPIYGIEDFWRAEGEYTFRYASKTTPSEAKFKRYIGKIVTDLPGDPPSFSGRDWLLAGVMERRRGFIFEIVEIYWLSGEGGWPKPIYKGTNKA